MLIKQKHSIQIVSLLEENNKPILKTVGFIYIKDKNQIVFNPSMKDFKKMHWTWHEDGMVHIKGQDGKILTKHKRVPLNKFKGQSQFLFSALIKQFSKERHIDYKLCEDSSVFLIDLRQFTKGLGLSIHMCDYLRVNKAMNIFKDKPHHQSFIYWKSNPKVVIIAFDN